MDTVNSKWKRIRRWWWLVLVVVIVLLIFYSRRCAPGVIIQGTNTAVYERRPRPDQRLATPPGTSIPGYRKLTEFRLSDYSPAGDFVMS